MKRLTEKNTEYCEKENAEIHKEMLSKVFENYERFGKIENKLKKLEDLEEEIGCPLEVIGKLRKANCIYRDDGICFGLIGIDFNDEDKLILYNDDEWCSFTSDLKLADYKKTWWLKKDKSE